MGTPYSGGNAQPLKWVYSPHILSAPPPPAQKLMCYFKQVSNKGDADVRDVRWEVANFFRRIVPKGTSPASCPQVVGDTKPGSTNGPLYYGASSEAYDTTVLQPKDGWGESASSSSPTQFAELRDSNGHVLVGDNKLDTALTFYADNEQGKPVPVRLIFTTGATPKGDDATQFKYFVTNDSEAPLGVLVNLSATPELLKSVPMLQRTLWVKPGDKLYFEGTAEGQKSIQQAAIVIYDSRRNIVAIDSAAFYTVPGKKEVPDASFWERLH
jgi:hypothetical protein